jgi:HD-GYP domain-containing protein (c-di-GMP phosphodiesterase class II)
MSDGESTITLKGYVLPSFEGLSPLSVKPQSSDADLSRVSAATPTATSAPLQDDALIEWRRSAESRSLAPRITTALIAGAFIVVAFGALALPAHRPLSVVALVATLACYVLCSRVHFEFGSGWAIPTQTVFVVMWFVLPPRLLPLIVCAALVAGAVPDLVRGRMPLSRLSLLAANSWHAVGPAVVLFFWGTHAPRWSSLPVYAGALAAQLFADYVSTFLTQRPVLRLTPVAHLRAAAPAYKVDALLAPLGLLVAFPSYYHPLALFLVLPVLVMFSTFSKERQHRIDNALELSGAYRGTAMLLGDVIEADDAYTGSHSRDVVDLVLAVADTLGLDAAERRNAEFAALLHDVGKVKIPSEIINKPGALDDAEWEIMKTHTILGEEMLEQVGGVLGDVGRVVRSCHERWDGGGYPDGLAAAAIPLSARIVCACDAWSAMRTDRSYRKALPLDVAAAELRKCAGTHFDPQVVEALCATLELP